MSGSELPAPPVKSIGTFSKELQPVQLKSVSSSRLRVRAKARPRLASSGIVDLGLDRQLVLKGSCGADDGVELRVAGRDLGQPGAAVVVDRDLAAVGEAPGEALVPLVQDADVEAVAVLGVVRCEVQPADVGGHQGERVDRRDVRG